MAWYYYIIDEDNYWKLQDILQDIIHNMEYDECELRSVAGDALNITNEMFKISEYNL